MIRSIAATVVLMLIAAGCSSDDPEPVAQSEPEPATETNVTSEPDGDFDTSGPPVEDDEVDFASRDLAGEPAAAGIVDMIEGMSIPDGAVQVISANMIRHREVYYVVAAVATTPDGTQILTYLHSPWDQDDIGNGGLTEPLNFAAQQWAPLASPSEDEEAYEVGERLIVDRP